MTSLSPDSQLKELQKKIAVEEQRLNNLQTSTKVAQEAWDDQRKQIVSDTQITIRSSRQAIAQATEEAKVTLSKLKTEIISKKDILAELHSEWAKLTKARTTENEKLEYANKVLARTHASLENNNLILSSEIEVKRESTAELKQTKEVLSSNIAELHRQDEQAADHLVELRKQEQDATNRIEQLQNDYDMQKAAIETDISKLELKRQDLEHQIIESYTNNDKIRENLADWQKTLDEKDANLRIREAKVAEQEKAIVRNYNLLQL